MARPRPEPLPAPGTRTIAGIALIIAGLVFGVPLVMVATNPDKPAPIGTSQAALYVRNLQALDPIERHSDVSTKIAELTALTESADFAALPRNEQERVQARIQELTAFRDFERQVAALPDPADATNLEQLQQIQTKLLQVSVPPPYQYEWSQTEPGQRLDELRAEALALDRAVFDLESTYRKLIKAAEKVIATAEQAGLPSRARQVLQMAMDLPNPDSTALIPGSKRIPYRTLFRFPTVAYYQEKWADLARTLKPFTLSDRPN